MNSMKLRPIFGQILLVPTACAFGIGTSAAGAAQVDPGLACDYAAAAAAERTGVPIDILLAITRVESGRGGGDPRPWPWTINADGRGDWYDTKDLALETATAHLSDGTGTFDVGCFQLNVRWHGDGFDSLSDMLDPAQNADYAAAFLMQLYQESGEWSAAVSAYHSRTPELADSYLQKVRAILEGPEPLTAPTAGTSEVRVARENLFPLLQAGGQGSAGSIVPLQSARGPLIGGNS
jgi:Transglycosylase SLT domain